VNENICGREHEVVFLTHGSDEGNPANLRGQQKIPQGSTRTNASNFPHHRADDLDMRAPTAYSLGFCRLHPSAIHPNQQAQPEKHIIGLIG